jgi:hypothetical protein
VCSLVDFRLVGEVEYVCVCMCALTSTIVVHYFWNGQSRLSNDYYDGNRL